MPGVAAPAAVLDLDSFEHNLTELTTRTQLPIRVASKSVRVRELLTTVLAHPGYAGVLAYSAAEALWLVGHGLRDVVVAYPTVDRQTVAAVSADPVAAAEISFMADLPEHLDLLASAAGAHPVRVCFDIDCSLRAGPIHLGAHRSSLRRPRDAAALAADAASRPELTPVGLMFYDAQVAGVPDSSAGVRAMKKASWAQLRRLRRRVFEAVSQEAQLEFVNAGGTGSLSRFADDPVPTDLAAGSGLFSPASFDDFDGSTLRPAAYFVAPVVRRPSPDVVVTFSGGYAASGVAGTSRSPLIAQPLGLKPFGQEGFGEVQTPLHGAAARDLDLGDLVWFRHAKAGEMCERFNELLLMRQGKIVQRVPTYRGEGQNFG